MIHVHVLQVNTDPQNIADLAAAVAAGHTDVEGWPKAVPRVPRRARVRGGVGWHVRRRVPLPAKDEPIRLETVTNRRGTEPLANMMAAVETGTRPEGVTRAQVRLDVINLTDVAVELDL